MGDDDKRFFHKLKNMLQPKKEQTEPKQKKFLIYITTVFILGLSLMIFGSFSKNPVKQAVPIATSANQDKKSDSSPVFGQEKSNKPDSMTEYEHQYESQLKEILEGIIGVDSVSVMVNLDATEAKVYEKDLTIQSQTTDETDREGGKREVEDSSREEKVVIIRSGDQEKPIIVKTLKPKVRGILIVAEGADNIKVKQMIVEAVTKVLDVPVHKVSVLPKKFEEES